MQAEFRRAGTESRVLQLFKAEPQQKRKNTREEGRGEAGIYLHPAVQMLLERKSLLSSSVHAEQDSPEFPDDKRYKPRDRNLSDPAPRDGAVLQQSNASANPATQTSEIRAVQLSLIPAAPVQSDNLAGVTGLS